MLHARIAARAFNTPLLVEPSKAMAFLSGFGPRILGRQVELAGSSDMLDTPHTTTLPPRTSVLSGRLAETYRQHGDAPYPVLDGIAVIEISGVLIHRGGWIGQSSGQTSYEGIAAQIEAAASDPAVRGLALEIDSFGGEVAGVFDLADRIRAIRAQKPVWAFVAEHAFSAGYALASQADRILVPRTGALGSIGVVVMHADLSGQLDQDGVRVTLIHSGRHKVDANPYQPLPEAVQDGIQREIDMLRELFAQTVAAGRSGRLNEAAALATQAATYRGADAVAAGLADEVSDLAAGFAGFRQFITPHPTLSPARNPRASLAKSQQEARMATRNDHPQATTDDATQIDTNDLDTGHADAVPPPATDPEPHPAFAATQTPVSETATAATPAQMAAQPSNLAELSTRLREAAAEIAEIAAQAGRLGIAIDAAKALREGTQPEALRRLVLDRASAAADARDIVAAAPPAALPVIKESPLVAAAKRAALAKARS